MKLTRTKRNHGVTFNITPMIDIVFLLIIFFMTVSQITRVVDLIAAGKTDDGFSEIAIFGIRCNDLIQQNIVVQTLPGRSGETKIIDSYRCWAGRNNAKAMSLQKAMQIDQDVDAFGLDDRANLSIRISVNIDEPIRRLDDAAAQVAAIILA